MTKRNTGLRPSQERCTSSGGDDEAGGRPWWFLSFLAALAIFAAGAFTAITCRDVVPAVAAAAAPEAR